MRVYLSLECIDSKSVEVSIKNSAWAETPVYEI